VTSKPPCDRVDDVHAYALDALPPEDRANVGAHLGACAECRTVLDSILPVVARLDGWPVDTLRAPRSLWTRLATRLGFNSRVTGPAESGWREPEWSEVAPGISTKLLSRDSPTETVSMMVRLAPGVAYPAHTHAGVEELHLLDGELWIDDRKLYPGDYNRAEPGTTDRRVWSDTGCTCVLIASGHDILR